MASKRELLRMLREEFDRWEKLLAGLSEEQIVARTLPSDLSIKDVIAHLEAWQQLSSARLEAALNNRVPDFHLDPKGLDPDAEENLERINAWIHETNLNRPWAEVHQSWQEGLVRFLELGEAIPERDLMEVGKYPWLGELGLYEVLKGCFEHYHEEHYEPLAEWMREKGWMK